MIYEIKLLKSINNIKFGISFLATRFKISEEYICYNIGVEEFKDDFPVDYYKKLGIFCHYDEEGFLEAMAFLPPARPILGGVDVLSLTWGQAVSLFKRLDPDLEFDEDEATSYRLSVGFPSADPEEGDDAALDSILFGRPGYYDAVKPDPADARASRDDTGSDTSS